MKFRMISLAAVALLSGNVFAAISTPVTAVEANGATDKLFISGSSAAKGIVAGLISQNCVPGSLTTFTGPTVTSGGISGGLGNIYACHVKAGNDWALPEDTVVVVNKRDFLGSGFGVFPVALSTQTAVTFTDVTTCSDATKLCTGTVTKIPDAGISDEEPTLFNSTLNRPIDFKTAAAISNADFGTVTPLFSQVFGVGVTTKLFAELQAAQGLSGSAVPSLTSAQVANLLSTSVRSQGWKGVVRFANQGVGVNICTRDIGSGTRAAANAFFLQYPGNGGAGLQPFGSPVTQANSTVPSITANRYYINEAGSGGGVVSCLGAVNALAGNAYGIGLVTLGTATDANFSFVAIDGVLPSRDNAKTGKYGFWVESTIQTSPTAVGYTDGNGNAVAGTLTPGAAAFLSAFITQASYSGNLAQVGAVPARGVFALPSAASTVAADDCSAYTGAAATYPAVGDTLTVPADAFCSRFTRNGSTASLPKFVK